MNLKRTMVVAALGAALAVCLLHATPGAETPLPPKTITFVADNMINEDMGLGAVLAKFKELTGVELKVIIPPHQQYSEKLQVMASSGDLPDVWQVWTPLDITFAREGVDIPLDDFIATSKNVKRIAKGHFLPFTVGGKIYGVPFNQGGGTVTYIRKDWLDALGLAMPKNLDEMIAVAKAFATRDPDGNGKIDTLGYTSLASGTSLSVYYWPNLFQGAVPDFVQQGGAWIDGFTLPNMKEAIQRIRQGYVEGWIDPEIFTNTTGSARDKFTHGTAGMFAYWSGAWGPAMQTQTVAGSGPKADVQALPPLDKANYWNRASVPQCITAKAENPKFVFDTLLDRMWDQGEMEFLFIHGVEGVHWTREGSVCKVLPNPANPTQPFSKVYIHPELTLLPLKEDPFQYDPRLFSSEKTRLMNMKQYYVPSGGEVYAKNVGDLSALRLEVFSKIVAGDMSMDDGYRYYEEKARQLQIDVMIKELGGS
jgi:putative aldouronate transport system substrate-binding protein